MDTLRILLGLAVLALGRRLFWLFVGVMGFVSGWNLVREAFHGEPNWIILFGATLGGLLGALLAVFLKKLAVGIAGFLAGSYLSMELPNAFGWDLGGYWKLLLVVGGILGALLLLSLFDWALIVLSSFAGATLIVRAVHPGPAITLILFAALLVGGIGTQAFLWKR